MRSVDQAGGLRVDTARPGRSVSPLHLKTDNMIKVRLDDVFAMFVFGPAAILIALGSRWRSSAWTRRKRTRIHPCGWLIRGMSIVSCRCR